MMDLYERIQNDIETIDWCIEMLDNSPNRDSCELLMRRTFAQRLKYLIDAETKRLNEERIELKNRISELDRSRFPVRGDLDPNEPKGESVRFRVYAYIDGDSQLIATTTTFDRAEELLEHFSDGHVEDTNGQEVKVKIAPKKGGE